MKRKIFLILAFFNLWIPASISWGAERDFILDPALSTVTFYGGTPLHSFSGTTHDLKGFLRLDIEEKKFLGDSFVEIPILGLDTGIESRNHAMAYSLGFKKQPVIYFEVLDIDFLRRSEKADIYHVTALLKIAGHVEKIQFDAQAIAGDGELNVDAEMPLLMNQFNLKLPPLARVMRLKNEVRVVFHAHWILKND